MKFLTAICFLLLATTISAQNLDQVIEEYIRKNNVITVLENDTSYHKIGKTYLKKYASGGKSLTLPKGTIPIPMPTGNNDVRGKFYTSNVQDNVKLTLYVVQSIGKKEVVNAVNGGNIIKGNRTKVDILVDYKTYQRATIYCYFLNGVVFGAPFLMTEDYDAKIVNFVDKDIVIDQDIPAILIFEEEKGSQRREKLVEKMKKGNSLIYNKDKYENIYKQLGNYCIIYYRLTKNEEKK